MRSIKIPARLSWIMSVMMILLVLMSLYRLLFFYQYNAASRPFSGSAFLLGIRYDLRVAGIIGLSTFLLTFIPYLNPFRNKKAVKLWTILYSLVFLIFLIFYAGDFYHYDYLQQRLNSSVLNFLEDAAISLKMMWETYPIIIITIVLIILVYLFARLMRILLLRYSGSLHTNRPYIYQITFFILCAVMIFGNIGQYPLRWSDAFRFADDYKANVALNPFQSFFSSLKFRKSTYNISKVRSSYKMMAEYLQTDTYDSINLNYNRRVVYTDTFVNKPNVIVVICESFSASKSSMFGNKLNPTPYFNELCNNGVFFERCFVPTFGTARGVWATITGIPDVETPKTASRNPAAVDQHTILNDFTGYSKFYFLGGSTTWANIRGVLTNNITGLKIYEEGDYKSGKVDVWGISDKNLFLEANNMLSKQTAPFFAIIQTADNHRPYTIPAEDIGEFKKIEYPEDTLAKYGFAGNDELNAFRYTDFCFMKFMEACKKQPYFNNTIFVFIGDHGLRGSAGNMFPASFTQQGIGAQHVPLLFYAPSLLSKKRITTVCSQLDILPSVASLARQSYLNTTLGLNLFDSLRSQPRYAFIADPDLQTIGVLNDAYYYRKNIKTGEQEYVPVVFSPVAKNDSYSNRPYMHNLADAFYETSRYMLLNNKKKQ